MITLALKGWCVYVVLSCCKVFTFKLAKLDFLVAEEEEDRLLFGEVGNPKTDLEM